MLHKTQHLTNFFECLMHLLKGNIGIGLFAMGDAFRNGGLLVGTVLTILIAAMCVHCQHILLNSSDRVRRLKASDKSLDYAETVGECFSVLYDSGEAIKNGEKSLKWYRSMRIVVNTFLCVTQLGFCCIYFVFIGTTLKQYLEYYGFVFDFHVTLAMILVPILLPALITNLKYLTPVTMVANFFIMSGLMITFYYIFEDGLPSIKDRNLSTNAGQLALYFGTTIFSFEGIALVLPLRNSMRRPELFNKLFGVLNIGLVFVTFLYLSTGFFGYLKWGEQTQGSLTLNLDFTNVLAQYVNIAVALGILLTFPIQYYILIDIVWTNILSHSENIFKSKSHYLIGEISLRILGVLLAFGIAEAVPNLGLFISLIGSFCSSALALIFPPLIELILLKHNERIKGHKLHEPQNKIKLGFVWVKNILIICVAILGCVTGSYESISAIIKEFFL